MNECSTVITLTASGGGMGAGWDASVEFRVSWDGFEVWETDYENTNGDDGSHLHRIVLSQGQLTWRKAVEILQARQEFGIGVDDFCDLMAIVVEGSPPWQADLLRLAWTNEESLFHGRLQFLLSKSDEEIKVVWDTHQSLCSEEAIYFIDELIGDQEAEEEAARVFARTSGVPDPTAPRVLRVTGIKTSRPTALGGGTRYLAVETEGGPGVMAIPLDGQPTALYSLGSTPSSGDFWLCPLREDLLRQIQNLLHPEE